MGLFAWLFGGKPQAERWEDRIWLTNAARSRGLANEAQEFLDKGVPVVVVAHFVSALKIAAESLSASGIPLELCDADGLTLDELCGSRDEASPARLTLARLLPDVGGTQSAGRLPEKVAIVVAERHPLPEHDETIARFANGLPCATALIYHASLEDPLLRVFAGEWVGEMLQKLGASENEPIESRMVGRRLDAAREKIRQQATGDEPAESPEEWFRLNCPAIRPAE